MKKLTALLLAVLMVVAVYAAGPISTVEAAETGVGTITINNATLDTKYYFYRVFDFQGEAGYGDDGTTPASSPSAYKYTLNERWRGLTSANNIAISDTETVNYSDFFEVDPTDQHIIQKTEKYSDSKVWGIKFSQFLVKYLKTTTPTIEAHATADSGSNRQAVYSGAPLGYYLIYSVLGDSTMLDTTTPTITVNNKNPRPYINKRVQEDSLATSDANHGWGITNDAEIGEDVSFRIIVGIDAGDTTEYWDHEYTVTDTLENGKWTFTSGSLEVKVQPAPTDVTSTPDPLTLTKDSDAENKNGGRYYTLDASDPTDTGFSLVLHGMQTNDTVYIEFKAKLKSDATVSPIGANATTTGNQNSATLTYIHTNEETADPKTTTINADTTLTYSWSLPIFKYTGESTALAGAKFKLYYATTANDVTTKHYATADTVAATATTDQSYTLSGWTETEADATEFVSDSKGNIVINGLDAGEYYLEETAAPSGYNKLKNPLKLLITSTEADSDTTFKTRTATLSEYARNNEDTDYSDTADVKNDNKVSVLNSTGTELPATGGIGTTLFYVLGAVLVLGVAVVFTVRRRMSVEG